MKRSTFLSLILAMYALSLAALLSSCSNNNAAGAAKDGSASDAAGATGGSGDDMVYEYTISTVGSSMTISGTTKLYLSAAGGARMEMDMTNSANKQKDTGPLVVIGTKDKPNQSISIDDDAKTYTVNDLDSLTAGGDFGNARSSVSKIGEDKILGFNCVHARIVTTRAMGSLFNTTDTFDIWKSPDVPVQSYFLKYMEKFDSRTGSFMYAPGAADQLKQMGCTGFMVKLEMHSKNVLMTDALTKVQKGDFPKSMFEVPAGYKEKKD
jgi:hypothetical protein